MSRANLHWIIVLLGLFVMLLSSISAQPAGYEHRKLITLNSSQINGSVAHTNFPIMVKLSDVDLKSTTNGGGVVSPSGYDILFSQKDSSTLLDHELQNYSASTGDLLCWVRFPSLSPTVNDTIFLYYGKTGIYSDQSVTSTWNANYLGVWHLEDLTDSSPNGNTFTDHSTVTNSSGYLGSAREFDGDGDDLEDLNGATYLNGLSNLSISLWAKANAIGTDRGLFYGDDPDASERRVGLRHDASGDNGGQANVFRSAMRVDNAGTTRNQRSQSSTSSATANWQHLTLTRSDGTATNLYIDGGYDTPSWDNLKAGVTTQNSKFLLGKGSNDGATSSWAGLIDEVRVSNVELSVDWISTEYNNMTAPGSFHTVSVDNELPYLTDIEATPLSYQENDPATQITGAIVCHDYNEFFLDSANIQITGNYLGTEDVLAFSTNYGISVSSWQVGTGILRLVGNASLANYTAALQEVTFQNSNPSPSTLTRTVSFSVSDGTGFSASVTRDITMNALNNAPVLSSIEGTTLAYIDGDPDTIITTAISISDADDAYLDSAWVTISTGYVSGEDKLLFTTANGISSSWSSVYGILTLSGSATKANYQLALRSVSYDNLNPDPVETTRTIDFYVSDGSAHSDTLARNLSVTAINDAPILAGMEAAGLVYNAGAGAIVLTDSITVYDGDDVLIDSARVQITTNYISSEDVLAYSTVYGITGVWYSGVGLLVLTGSNSMADYEIALRTITYENIQPTPQTSTRVITITASDGLLYSNGVTRSISSGAPATISGLDLWLNANEGVYSNGAGTTLAIDADLVQVWKDQSGNGRDFVDNGGQPVLQTGVVGLNGASGVEFSGTGTAGMVDGDGELYMTPLSEFTTFFVVQSYSTGTDKGLMMLRNPGNGDKEYTVRYDAIGDNGAQTNVIKVAVGSDIVANELESIGQIQTTDPQVICLDWKSGLVWDLYIDGVLNNPSYSGSPPTGTVATGAKFLLGRGPQDATTSWDGLMAEVIHYGKHLSDSERETIEDYLAQKYAISMRLLSPATGGDSLSADDANTTFTTLTGPRITEDISGELTSGGTIILNAPAGFEWDNTGTLPSVTVQKAYGVSTALALSYTSRTSSTITFTVNTPSNVGSQPGEVTFSGIQVRPTSAIVPSTGDITNSGTTGPGGATNLGTLTLIAGTPNKVAYTQEPANGSTNVTLSPAIQAEIRDANDNVIQQAGTAVSIAISTGTGNLTGSTMLNSDAQGSVSFSDLAIDANDTFQLSASSSGLTSAVSSNFTITTPGQFTTFLIEKTSGGNVLTQDAGVDFNVKISAVDGTQTPDVNFTGTVDITSTGILSNGSGTTAAFTAGVLSSHTLAISSVGNFTLTATNTSGSENGTSNSFTVQSGAASAVTSTITANPTVLKNDASSTSTITVQLKDAGGNNKSTGGETVNLVATAGTLLGSVVDHSDGTYSQSLQSSSLVELSTITGVLNAVGMTDDASVQFNAYTHIWESDPGNDPYTSDWNDALNWDNGIPTLTSAVLIPTNPAQGTKYPTISTDNLQVASLSIESGADVTLSGSISFDILGDLAGAGDINGGSLDTIRVAGDMGIATSDIQYVEFDGGSLQTVTSPLSYTNISVDNASGVRGVGNFEVTGTLKLITGSLIVPSGYSLIANTKTITSGNIRSERELTGDTGWRLLASPVSSTYGDLFNNIFTQGYTGSDSALGSPSVLWYDETYTGAGNTDNQRWRQPSNSTNATTAGRGLFVYVFGSIVGEDAYSDPLPITLDVSGDEDEGTAGVFDFGVTYTALADTGWNLVGNPFAATIDWDDVGWTKTNMDNVIYVWDHSANYGAGEYLTWNGAAGSLGSGLIPPFQGFWVKANAAAPVLKVPKTSKTTGGVFYKQAESLPLITIMIEADTLATTTFLDFNDKASRNKDGRDAYYLIPPTDTYLELYSISHDHSPLAIQSHPYRFGRPVEIPLSVAGYVNSESLGGTYRLSWPRVEGIHEEWTMTLEDLETGAIVDFESADFYEFELSGQLNKRLKSLMPSADLIKRKPFSLRKIAASKSPRFLIKIDPGDAFPEIPKEYALDQNYPNPFNEGTVIPFSLPLEATVSATIFDIRGREIERIIDNQYYQAGKYQLNWLASGRSSGIYLCHLTIGNIRFTRKMILLR
ncbi:MAG: DUF2341 domain-containing protein [Candidatus Marinimicrobia bacterium]|nr:DUF2341 domain-containing protein [Candidatus Neomarinimicrobiota bacterium]